ncbi:MAG TPA: GIY-YIG nuclease family protein [Patescibacteria group bacterium]|nr:GIY-YIG nuclease family protein [Patescibacteria group bacterium]
MKTWYLYLVRCADGTLYTGISNDVARRLVEHQSGRGRGARYLRGRGPLVLARKVRVGGKSDAFKLEWYVKKFSRAGKEDLIRGKIRIKDLLAKKKSRALVDE